jgi:hypothetical protein
LNFAPSSDINKVSLNGNQQSENYLTTPIDGK